VLRHRWLENDAERSFPPVVICPKQHVFTLAELQSHSSDNNAAHVYTSIRGEVFDITNFANVHPPAIVPSKSVLKYGGKDASAIFPVQVNALCSGTNGNVNPWVTLETTNVTDPNAVYHDFRAFTDDVRPDWYYESMILLRSNYRKGFMGYTHQDVQKRAGMAFSRNTVIYNTDVYDMTDYITNNNGGTLRTPTGTRAPDDTSRSFMADQIVSLFTTNAGTDITHRLDNLNLDPAVLAAQKTCLRNLFFIGLFSFFSSIRSWLKNPSLIVVHRTVFQARSILVTRRSVNLRGISYSSYRSSWSPSLLSR
jgi:chitin synthase